MITRDQVDGVASGVFSSVWSGESKHPYSSNVVMVKQYFGEKAQDANFARVFMRNSCAIYSGLDDVVEGVRSANKGNELKVTEKQLDFIVENLKSPQVIFA